MFVFILSQKKAIFYQCSLKKHLEPGAWSQGPRSRSDTEHRLRSPTPTPNPRPINWVIRAAPNNSSLIQPDLSQKTRSHWLRRAGNRTIVPKPEKPGGQRTGTFASKRTIVQSEPGPTSQGAVSWPHQSEQSQSSATFFGRSACWAGKSRANNYSIYAQTGKKRTKKTRARSPGFLRTIPPFYVINNK